MSKKIISGELQKGDSVKLSIYDKNELGWTKITWKDLEVIK
ncbi:MAG: hypothetical protein ABI855_19865 [Bacteroidota bacterium]